MTSDAEGFGFRGKAASPASGHEPSFRREASRDALPRGGMV